MIYVCWADVSRLDDRASGHVVSDYRREKLCTLQRPEDRRRALGAELLLLHALGRCCPELPLPPRIECEEGGKPFLRDAGIHFNLSHSGDFAACALSEEDVGLDLQIPISAQERLLRRVLTAQEREYLEYSKDRDAAFTELWCRKESFIKATGRGLAAGLDSFCAAPGREELLYGNRRFAIRYVRFPAFHLAVCFPAEPAQTVEIEQTQLP